MLSVSTLNREMYGIEEYEWAKDGEQRIMIHTVRVHPLLGPCVNVIQMDFNLCDTLNKLGEVLLISLNIVSYAQPASPST